jgi:hypothetical protein
MTKKSTWEPIKNLKHCKEMIEKYHQDNDLKCAKCEYVAMSERSARTIIDIVNMWQCHFNSQ